MLRLYSEFENSETASNRTKSQGLKSYIAFHYESDPMTWSIEAGESRWESAVP